MSQIHIRKILNLDLKTWVESRVTTKIKGRGPKDTAIFLDCAAGLSEGDWGALRAQVREFAEMDTLSRQEQSHRELVVQRYMRDLPRREINGQKYDQPWSYGLQLAALRADRQKTTTQTSVAASAEAVERQEEAPF